MAEEKKEIAALLQEAAAAVEAAELPPDLRSAGFVLAYRDLTPAAASDRPERPTEHSTTPAGPLGELASHLHVEFTALRRLVDLDDDGAHLLVQRRWLDEAKRPAMRQLALMTVAMRQAGGFEDWTPLSEVREVCQHYGVLDQKHFSEDVKAIAGVRIRRTSSGTEREVKATVATLEEAGQLFTRVADTARPDA
jgi:hypothetical protein